MSRNTPCWPCLILDTPCLTLTVGMGVLCALVLTPSAAYRYFCVEADRGLAVTVLGDIASFLSRRVEYEDKL